MTTATHTTAGLWEVTTGMSKAIVHAQSPSEARRFAVAQWGETPEWAKGRLLSARLISGFPEIPGYELILGETVIKGDCLPEADSPLYRVINSEDDLDIYLLDVPSHATFTPPFRPHANSKGQWKCKVLDEGRDRANEAIGAIIDDDRRKGRDCE